MSQSSYPLGFDTAGRQPAVVEQFVVYEFVKIIRQQSGKLMFGNAVLDQQFWGFDLFDIMVRARKHACVFVIHE